MTSHPKSLVGWRVWYDTNSVYDSHAFQWADLPDDGILIIIKYFSDGTRQVVTGYDRYFLAGSVLGGNNDPEADISRRYPGVSIKRGRWAEDPLMVDVERAALESRWP